MIVKVAPQSSEETERAILSIAPEQEGLDWICYRVRGGAEPAGDDEEGLRLEAVSAAPPQVRPDRQVIEAALGRLVSLGMLSFDGRRWSMTRKGYAAH